MKKSPYLISLLFIVACNRNPPKTVQQETDWIASLDSLYIWDIQQESKGKMMFLDVPYIPHVEIDSCKAEYLTLCVAKYKSKARPVWISIILPNNIVQNEGVFLFFKDSPLNPDRKVIEDSTQMSIRVNLEQNSPKTLTARLKNGFALDEQNHKVDVFQRFLDYDMVYLMVFMPDGGHKTIAVPLKYFKIQYRQIESETPVLSQ